MKNILIPIGPYTDPSPLLELRDLIKGFEDSNITLLGVLTVPFVTPLEESGLKDTEPYKRIRDKVLEAEEFLRNMNKNIRSRIVVARSVPEAIVEVALSEEYDLIILIKRARPPKLLHRSVSQAVISKMPRPILILTME